MKMSQKEKEKRSRLRKFFRDSSQRNTIHNLDTTQIYCSSINDFVNHCVRTEQPGFQCLHDKPMRLRYRNLPLANLHFDRMNAYLDLYDENCSYSPNVDLFFSVCRKLGLFHSRFTGRHHLNHTTMTDADRFNELVMRVRDEALSLNHQKRLQKLAIRRENRFLDLVDYVDALFKHGKSKYIVIRVDLSYRESVRSTLKPGMAQEDLQHLLNNQRSNRHLFGDLEGYIWKLEQSSTDGDHFHLLMFFNCNHWRNDVRLAELIGKYWGDVITKGRGTYFNCHRSTYRTKHKHAAIGHIEAIDSEKRFNLLYLLSYLCKEEQAINVKMRRNSRSVGRGEMPVMGATKLGSPRTKLVPTEHYIFTQSKQHSV